MAWAQTKRAAAGFFHLVDGASLPLSFDDLQPLMPLASNVFPSDPFPMLPVATGETFSSSMQIAAEHSAHSDRPYLLPGYHPYNLLSPSLTALELSVPDLTLNVVPGYSPTQKSLTVQMLGLQSQVRQRYADVHKLEGRLLSTGCRRQRSLAADGRDGRPTA